MAKVKIEQPKQEELEQMNISSWPIWEKEPSKFNWSYGQQETCYLLEGKAKVDLENGESVEFGAGDMITFPEGLNCVWDIKEKVKKHYKLG